MTFRKLAIPRLSPVAMTATSVVGITFRKLAIPHPLSVAMTATFADTWALAWSLWLNETSIVIWFPPAIAGVLLLSRLSPKPGIFFRKGFIGSPDSILLSRVVSGLTLVDDIILMSDFEPLCCFLLSLQSSSICSLLRSRQRSTVTSCQT